MVTKLSMEESRKRMAAHPGWQLWGSAIARSYWFPTFAKTMEFVNRVAQLAEEMGHHPDISISYTRITLTLTTHSVAGLTEQDFELAAKIEAEAGPAGAKAEAWPEAEAAKKA